MWYREEVRAGWIDALRGASLRGSWRCGAADYKLGFLVGWAIRGKG